MMCKTPTGITRVTTPFIFSAFTLIALMASFPLSAAPVPSSERPAAEKNIFDRTLQSQQQRQRALEETLTPPTPDVRLSPPPSSFGRIHFESETPCFQIDRVKLSGQEALPHWLPLQRLARQGEGHCLGGKGINQLMSTLQNRLIDHGYVTSRVLAPNQDLTRGTLSLVILPGYVHEVKRSPDSDRWLTLWTAFPAHAGNLLDLCDIEQGLENLQRLPTVQASMEVAPGALPGESDIVVQWQQRKMWRLGASLDDSGSVATGRYQGGATLSLDNPFSLSDLFYLSGTRSLKTGNDKGSKNITAHYSVPFGYWMASATASDYDYHQTVAGLNQDYLYRGKRKNLDVQLSRVLHRSGTQKTSVSGDVLTSESHNYIADTEVEVQHRKTAAWRLGLSHRHYIGQSTLDAGISYQRGTRWFGAIPAPEEYSGNATAKSKIVTLSAGLDIPFKIVGESFRYNVQYLRQISSMSLTPQDELSIGGRWTVRGFDGERNLSASRGGYVRNDLAWRTPLPQQEFYLGADYGEVGGTSSAGMLIGQHLAGGVAGLRGDIFNTGYDAFAGVPFSRPDGFKTSPYTLGFSLNWSY
ncbi:ShlB/FhaC/HecB family hemolysin secretion/activation protein [Pseudomonas cerasi]